MKLNLKFNKSLFLQNLEFLLEFFGKIQEIELNWIFMIHFYGIFNTSLSIWGISFHNLKYLDKPIKCLEMRAKIKSVRKINEIFLCIFTYIWKLDIFSTYLNFDKKWFFGYFKSLFIKCNTHMNILPHISWQKYEIKAIWYEKEKRQSLNNTLYICNMYGKRSMLVFYSNQSDMKWCY